MKKILLTSFIVALGLLGASCKDDNSTAGGGGEILPDQQVSCEIFMPTNGETVIISDKLIIRGEGTTNYGKIISAELKVGGEVITDISSVPFYYEYTFPKEAEPGELKIELAVKGDHEGSALATITVTTELGDRPAPPQYGEDLTDTRDGNVYKTIQLAEQIWMAENLRYLPEQNFDISSTAPKYYVMFDSDIKTDLGKAYLKAYGAYYNLPAALQGETALGEDETRNIKGVCPDGWHIPSQKEWQTLSKYVLDSGMAAIMNDGQVDETAIAKALASTTMWMLPEYTEIEPQPTCAGCKKNTESSLTPVTLNEVAHSIFYAPQYVAIEEGYFADEGIDLTLITGFGADKVLTAMISGEADIGFMGAEATVYAYLEGTADPVVNFAQLTQRAGNFVVGREKDNSFTWEKLKNKEVLGGRKGGMPEMVFEYVLAQKGIDKKDVNINQSIDFGSTAAALPRR